MKKLFVLLLSLVVVGGIFAQDAAPALKLTGALYGAIEYHDVADAADAPAVIRFARSDSEGYSNAWRTRINGAYTNGDYGFNFRLQSSSGNTAPTFTRTYAWAKFLGGMVGIKAGYLYEGAWMTQGDAGYGEQDSVGGFAVNVTPIEGLAFGTYLPVTTVDEKATYAIYNGAIGAAYSLKGIGDFQVGILGSKDGDQTDYYFGFNLTAVEKLTAAFEFEAQNLGAEDTIANVDSDLGDTAGLYQFVETIEYALDPLTLGFIGYQNMYTTKDAVFGMSFEPYVKYAMGKTTLGLDFLYALDADNGTSVITTDAVKNYMVTPTVTFALGGNTLELGARISDPDMDTDDDNVTDVFAYFQWNF